jgi:Pectate lyase superfamily protein
MRKVRSKILLKSGLAILALCSLGALCPVLLAQTPSPQCPAPTVPYRTVRDSSGNLHDVACINPQTGKINWTVNDWGGQVYNVKAYGASGNGTSDDTQVFNSAYAACSAAGGGAIFVPPGTYKLTSGFIFTSPCAIIGVGSAVTVLNYIPTTGTAFVISSGSGHQPYKGFSNLTIEGQSSSNSTIGLQLGEAPSPQLDQYRMTDLRITGFGTGLATDTSGGNVFNSTCDNCTFIGNGVGADLEGEMQRLVNSNVSQNVTGLIVGQTSTTDAQVFGTSFDDNTTLAINIESSGVLTLESPHFENVGGGTANYITSSGILDIFGGNIMDDTPTGTNAQFITTSGRLYVSGTIIYSSGRVTTNVVNITSGNAFLSFSYSGFSQPGGSRITNEFTPGYNAGDVTSISVRSPGGPALPTWRNGIETLVGTGVPSMSCSIGSQYYNLSGGGSTTLYICTATNTWTAK